jgi:hypothetical protein
VVVVAMVACSKPPATNPRGNTTDDQQTFVRNVARGCPYVFEDEPGEYTMVVVADRVVWIEDTVNEIKIAHVEGGDVTTFEASEDLSIHDAIVVDGDLVVTNAERDSVQRIWLRERKVTTVVDGIHHPYDLAYAGGKYFIGGEDNFYRFDPEL